MKYSTWNVTFCKIQSIFDSRSGGCCFFVFVSETYIYMFNGMIFNCHLNKFSDTFIYCRSCVCCCCRLLVDFNRFTILKTESLLIFFFLLFIRQFDHIFSHLKRCYGVILIAWVSHYDENITYKNKWRTKWLSCQRERVTNIQTHSLPAEINSNKITLISRFFVCFSNQFLIRINTLPCSFASWISS